MKFFAIQISILLFLTLHIEAQKIPAPEFYGKSSLQTMVHSGVLPPLWHVALQEGRWDNLGGNQLLATAFADMTWQVTRSFSMEAMAEIDHAGASGETYLHTGWIGINWKNLTLKGGKHAFDPVFSMANTGSGSYLFGRNYRPVSRVSLEMPAYTRVPFTDGRIEVRGGISQGWLNNQPYNGDVLLHEKYAYVRWNGDNFKPYAGLNHSSLFGGKWNRGGDEIPVDFWATFRAGGSEKIGGGEAANAAGAHMGLYDFGIYINTAAGPVHFFYQIPFSDGSGMRFWQRNRDQITGVSWNPENISWLNNLTIEWMQTTYQSGNGMPDPGALVNGDYISISKIVNSDTTSAFMSHHFGIEKSTWTDDEIEQILKKHVNNGNQFGGRDGYMNNGLYPDGWSRNNHIMGSPFNLMRQQLLETHPEMTFNHRVQIKNDRYRAIYAGARTNITPLLKSEIRIAYTRNFGTYYEQYPGRYTWDETENYWFKGGRDQWYMMLGADWKSRKVKGLNFLFGIAFDTGDIYQTFGVKAGVVYKSGVFVKK